MSKKQEALDKIRAILGDPYIKNGNKRLIYNNTVGLFDNEMDMGSDFYFIPLSSVNPEILLHDREEVWMIPQEKIHEHLRNENSHVIHNENYTKYIFPMKDAVKLFPQESTHTPQNSVSSVNKESTQFTRRDKICVELKVPKADSEWVNELINDYWQLQYRFAKKFNKERQ